LELQAVAESALDLGLYRDMVRVPLWSVIDNVAVIWIRAAMRVGRRPCQVSGTINKVRSDQFPSECADLIHLNNKIPRQFVLKTQKPILTVRRAEIPVDCDCGRVSDCGRIESPHALTGRDRRRELSLRRRKIATGVRFLQGRRSRYRYLQQALQRSIV